MWIFTKYGFFSIVYARKGKGERGQPIDPKHLMVRARMRTHLDSLMARFPGQLGQCEIREFAGTDYAYRLFVPKTAWMQVVSELADEIDYGNFKSEVAHYQGDQADAYEQSLHEVWSVMNQLQI